jgi:hypothetical protein
MWCAGGVWVSLLWYAAGERSQVLLQLLDDSTWLAAGAACACVLLQHICQQGAMDMLRCINDKVRTKLA